jgi:hypothetical protein
MSVQQLSETNDAPYRQVMSNTHPLGSQMMCCQCICCNGHDGRGNEPSCSKICYTCQCCQDTQCPSRIVESCICIPCILWHRCYGSRCLQNPVTD